MYADYPPWSSWEGEKPAFYELAFGAWSSWLVLYYGWALLLSLVVPSRPLRSETWRLGLVHLFGASFYIVNHYFPNAPFYQNLLFGYTILFFAILYVVLVLPLARGERERNAEDENEGEDGEQNKTLTVVQQVVVLVAGGGGYTVSFIFCENVGRLLCTGAFLEHQITAGPILPEAVIQVLSLLLSAIIIIAFNTTNKNNNRKKVEEAYVAVR